MAELSDRRVWPLGGYAPGNYSGRCRDCGAQYDGDKRSMICLECAVIGANARLATLSLDYKRAQDTESRLRIALWNEMRRNGVSQDVAIEMIREIADGPASVIAARSDETAQQAQPEGQVSGAQSAGAQKPDFAMSLNDLPPVSRD